MVDNLDVNKNSTPSETLYAEVKWLRTAHANSIDKGYVKSYRDGFEAAIGWIEFHARLINDMEKET